MEAIMFKYIILLKRKFSRWCTGNTLEGKSRKKYST